MDYTHVLSVGHWQNPVSENQSALVKNKNKSIVWTKKLKYDIAKVIMLATEEIFMMAWVTCLFRRCLSNKASQMCSVCLWYYGKL